MMMSEGKDVDCASEVEDILSSDGSGSDRDDNGSDEYGDGEGENMESGKDGDGSYNDNGSSDHDEDREEDKADDEECCWRYNDYGDKNKKISDLHISVQQPRVLPYLLNFIPMIVLTFCAVPVISVKKSQAEYSSWRVA